VLIIDFTLIKDTITQENSVVLVVLACAVVLFAGFVLYMSWKKGKILTLLRQMQMSGTTFVLGPEIGSFRGATAQYGKVKCDGVIALTDTFLVFVPYLGAKKEIPLKECHGVEVVDEFLGQRSLGMQVLVLRTDKCDIGFYVNDVDRWKAAAGNLVQKKREVS
jgi:hypothetical protein